MIKIQLLDDEPNILNALRRLLHNEDWEIHTFTDGQQALDALIEHEYAVIICDYKMPGLDGITYLQFAKQRQPGAIRMVLSAHGDRDSMMKAINRVGIQRFLNKPWDDHELEASVRTAIEAYRLSKENQALLDQVRAQQDTLKRQNEELRRLEAKYPGITQVSRDGDGSVLLFENPGFENPAFENSVFDNPVFENSVFDSPAFDSPGYDNSADDHDS